jgi:hypothetical protein
MNRKKDFRVRLRTKPAPCAGESVQASSDMIVAYQDESGANPHPDRSPPPVGRERSGAAAAAAAVDWGSGGGRGRGRGRAKGAGGVALHCAPLRSAASRIAACAWSECGGGLQPHVDTSPVAFALRPTAPLWFSVAHVSFAPRFAM